MNILFFLTPKSDVAYIFENETLRQTLEKMEHRKFSCIPLLSLDGKSVSDGDDVTQILYKKSIGDTLTAILYRSGKRYELTLTVEENVWN